MRIVSVEPFLTELVCSFGLGGNLVGVSHQCDLPKEFASTSRVTSAPKADTAGKLSSFDLDIAKIKSLGPELILSRVPADDDPIPAIKRASSEIKSLLGESVVFRSYNPVTLDGVFDFLAELGRHLKVPQKGTDLASRLKAQAMDWGDNFYERTKNKRVTILSSISPFRLAGYWVPDLIHLASAVSQMPSNGKQQAEVTWDEIKAFKPDVIIVAPEGQDLATVLKTFPILERLPDWEEVPAVKRGEVTFTDGLHNFYHPSSDLFDTLAILFSSIAGFESGYITKRDSFHRLRWLELHRHRV